MGREINYTGKPPLYYGPFEVCIHNQPDDCWVSFLGKVCDLTPLIKEHQNELCIRALLRFAGKDISDWFDEKTGDIAYHIHPVSGCRVPYLPHGPIPDIEHLVPATSWKPICGLPWWKDPKYQIGLLTKRVRQIKVINFDLTYVVTMTVCSEDTILRIKERYSIYNSSANQYIWKCNDRVLDDNLTLEENGIPNEQDKLVCIGLPASLGIPAIFIHYCDDFSRYRSESDESDDLKLL